MRLYTIKLNAKGEYEPITIDVARGESIFLDIEVLGDDGVYYPGINNSTNLTDMDDSTYIINEYNGGGAACVFKITGDKDRDFVAKVMKKVIKIIGGHQVMSNAIVYVKPIRVRVHEYTVREFPDGPVDTTSIQLIGVLRYVGKLNQSELKVESKITIGSTELTEAQLQSLLALLTPLQTTEQVEG